MLDQIATTLTSAGRWWITELSDLVPASLSRAREAGSRVVVDLKREGVDLLLEAGRHRKSLVPDLDTSVALGDAIGRLRSHGRQQSVVVRLPHADCFKRVVELPENARADYGQILALQLARVTPFKPGSIAEAHVVTGPGAQPGMLTVLHLAARRASFEPVVRELVAAGVQVATVDCWDETGTAPLAVDFLAGDRPASSRAGWWWLAGLAAVLIATAIASDDWRHDTALARVSTEASLLRPKVQAQQRSLDVEAAAVRERERVLGLRVQRPSVVAIVDELSRILPDSAVLQQMRVERDTIDISGTDSSVVGLLSLIEASRLFHDARLTSLVSNDQDGRERFGIRLQLRRPAQTIADAIPGGRS